MENENATPLSVIPVPINLENLSEEAIQKILARLPITAVFDSRLVSKYLLRLINNPRFPVLHFLEAWKGQVPSGLILHSPCAGGVKSDVYLVPDLETNPRAIKLRNVPFKSELPDMKVVGTCMGLVCFADIFLYRGIYVCNPLTGEFIKLPDINLMPKAAVVHGFTYGFGFNPQSQTYKVVTMRALTENCLYDHLEVFVHTVGTESWRMIGSLKYLLRSPYGPMWVNGSCGTLLKGNLHWLTVSVDVDGHCTITVVAVSLGDEKLRHLPPPPCVTHMISTDGCGFHLGQLSGCLIMVDDRNEKEVSIWVKTNCASHFWTKEFVITRPVDVGLRLKPISFPYLQPLLIDKDGKILVAHDRMTMSLYDPTTKSFEHISIPGLPSSFEPAPYVATLAKVVYKLTAEGTSAAGMDREDVQASAM